MIIAKSYAKVNLTLDILGRRPDGYHDLCSVFQTVSLHDTIIFKGRRDGKLVMECDDPSLPVGGKNLVIKAALLLRKWISEHWGLSTKTLGASISLKKKIPSGAGLGGGSSNAAVTLTTLLKLWNINKFPSAYLLQLASELGSDVPFFLTGGTCLVTGRGETVTKLKSLPKLHMVIIHPDVHVSTAWAYSNVTLSLTKQPKYSNIMSRLSRQGSNPSRISALLHNDLERAVIPWHPAIALAKADLLEAGALGSAMSGSGSSVFGIYPGKVSARKASRAISQKWPCSFLVQSVARA